MTKIIFFEDGSGDLLSISPALDDRIRRVVGEGEQARLETDDEVAARVAAQAVPSGADYHIFDAPVSEAELYARFPSALPAKVTTAKRELRAAVAARRWQAQTNMLYDGVRPVLYGADTAGNVLAAISVLSARPEQTIAWKLGSNAFRYWNVAQLRDFLAAGMAHIAACFAHEATLLSQIQNASTLAELRAIDIGAGWPA